MLRGTTLTVLISYPSASSVFTRVPNVPESDAAAPEDDEEDDAESPNCVCALSVSRASCAEAGAMSAATMSAPSTVQIRRVICPPLQTRYRASQESPSRRPACARG